MTQTIVSIREQVQDQPYPLDFTFEQYVGQEWQIKVFDGKSEQTALFARIHKDANGKLLLICNTSYFIGYYWLIPGQLAVHIEPKMNDSNREIEIDFLSMLRESLTEKENLLHLKGLQFLRTKEPSIFLKNDNHGLKIFLLFQFLAIIDRILRRGLKHSFYNKEIKFNYKLKGHILLSKSLKSTRTRTLTDHLTYSVQQFDLNTPANQYLKRALRLTLTILQSPFLRKERRNLIERTRRALIAFKDVDDKSDAKPITVQKVNPIFRDYAEALRLAKLILNMETAGHQTKSGHSSIPPYLINMAKLFELFAYKKLKELANKQDHIEYQFSANHQYLDYLCAIQSTKSLKYFIADAKYKPNYAEHNDREDLRQLAGYSRLCKVENTLRSWGWNNSSRIIPCLIIYPTLKQNSNQLQWNKIEKLSQWTDFFKIAVSLPLK